MTDTTTLTGPTPAARTATVSRTTSESDITVTINLDGSGKSNINTGVPFFDHMLTAFCVHGAFDLAIVLGQALAEAVGDKQGIRRFGSFSVPMDEALCEAVVDFSGRPYYVMRGEPEHMLTSVIGGHYATVINEHFFESLATNARVTLHVICHYGRDPHHITEAEFKAVARAIRAAVDIDPQVTGIPSTKGAL